MSTAATVSYTHLTDEKTKAFVDAYKAKFDDTPNQFAADAYDAIYVIYD